VLQSFAVKNADEINEALRGRCPLLAQSGHPSAVN